ncbi:hypothetical protein H311_00492 [Anncaliia algerae PRA109]|nr:hypothetical protein H311_00492 [Anncaliia algerae PRA109]
MFKFRCKSHRGRSPSNKDDALCIVEVNKKYPEFLQLLLRIKKLKNYSHYLLPSCTRLSDLDR